ncbi:MAG TPA: hypothetical protein VIL97_11975, partial [Thermoanaerobaculia bacterium]
RAFSGNVTSGSVEMIEVQPVLLKINSAIRDRKLTREEVLDLTESLREINQKAESKTGITVWIQTRPGARGKQPEKLAALLGSRASGLRPSSS